MSLRALLYKNNLLIRRAACGFVSTILFCAVIVVLLFALGHLIPKSVTANSAGSANNTTTTTSSSSGGIFKRRSSSFSLTTWINAQSGDLPNSNGLWDPNYLLALLPAFSFTASPTKATSTYSVLNAIRIITPASSNVSATLVQSIGDRIFMKMFGINSSMLQELRACTDNDMQTIFTLAYQTLTDENSIQISCNNLGDIRKTAITSLYNRLNSNNPPLSLLPLLSPFLVIPVNVTAVNATLYPSPNVTSTTRTTVSNTNGTTSTSTVTTTATTTTTVTSSTSSSTSASSSSSTQASTTTTLSPQVMIAMLYKALLPLVNSQLANELGYSNGTLIANFVARAQIYGCIAPVFNSIDTSTGAASYRLRTEYLDGISDGQPLFVQQNSWDMTDVPCGPTGIASTTTGCPPDFYQQNRFVQAQMAIDEAIISIAANDSSFTYPTVSGERCAAYPVQIVTYMFLIVSFVALAMLAYVPIPGAIAARLTLEKETKMKLLNLVLGMSPHAFWVSWAVIYLPLLVAITAGLTFALGQILTYWLSWLLIFIAGVLHSVATFGISFGMSAPFSRASTANIVSHLLSLWLFATFLASGFLRQGTLYPMGAAAFYALSLIEPICFGTLLQRIIVGDLINGQNMMVEYFPNQPTVIGLLLMLLLDAILYSAIGFLLEILLSEEYGEVGFISRIKSLCSSSRKRVNLDAQVISSDPSDIEPVPAGTQPSMAVSQLWKVFTASGATEQVVAVRSFSWDVYESEITCLLGPNGAGKSTFLSMLMGLTKPTRGSIRVYGHNMSSLSDRQKARESMGFCLQENVFYPTLNLKDHLRFISRLRNLNANEVEDQIYHLLNEFELYPFRNQPAGKLSGGQQRRLCIAMCLMGEPRFCVLDEPTTGVDPISRRQIWTALKNRRERRVILFTTHFMDEADLLADRKAIMTGGQLRCAGSSLFLKHRFGLGYQLTMDLQVNEEESVRKLELIVKSRVPGSNCKRTPNQLIFTLPIAATSSFPALFDSLDSLAQDGRNITVAASYGVRAYGIAMTNLEQVFLLLVNATQFESRLDTNANGKGATNNGFMKDGAENGHTANGYELGAVNGNVSQHNHALNAVEQGRSAHVEGPKSSLQLLIERARNSHLEASGSEIVRGLANAIQAQEVSSKWLIGKVWILLGIFLKNSLRNRVSLVARLIVTFLLYMPVVAYIISSVVSTTVNPKPISISPYMYLASGQFDPNAPFNWQSTPLSLNTFLLGTPTKVMINEALVNQALGNLSISSSNTSTILNAVGQPPWSSLRNSGMPSSICTELTAFSGATYILPPSLIRLAEVGQATTPWVTLANAEVTIGYNQSALHSLPSAVNLLSNVLLQLRMAQNGTNLSKVSLGSIEVEQHQLTFNNRIAAMTIVRNGLAQMLSSPYVLVAAISGLLLLGFAGSEVVADRECGVTNLMRLAGIRGIDYWIARSIYDVIPYLVVMAIHAFLLLQPWSELLALESSAAKVLLCIAIVLYAFQCIPFVYATSFLFDRSSSALLFYMLILILGTVVSYASLFVYGLIDTINESDSNSTSIDYVYQVLRFGFIYLIPPYGLPASAVQIEGNFTTLFSRLINVAINPNWQDNETYSDYFHFQIYNDITEMNLLWPFSAMAAHALLMAALVAILHQNTYFVYRPLLPLPSFCKGKPARSENVNTRSNTFSMGNHYVDEDVKSEERIVDSLSQSNQGNGRDVPVVMLEHAEKQYSPPCCDGPCCCCRRVQTGCCCTCDEGLRKRKQDVKKALKGVSVRVQQQELFGLLGPNGAGKSSAMKLIVGEENPNAGRVHLCGKPIGEKSSDRISKQLNYCPQKDTLWPRLTPSEIFSAFAAFRGITASTATTLVSEAVKALRIEKYMHREFQALSGGTKRKVVFVASVLGQCNAVLFDEPTSGLDPESRRLLWNIMLALFQADQPISASDNQANKIGRCCVLTTHSLEEAEALCSRIAIMLKGEIYALGSIQHLKDKLGAGYMLEIKIKEGTNEETLKRFVEHLFPHSKLYEAFSYYLCFRVPKDDVPHLARVFEILEAERMKYGISEYSFSQTTLEQMFIDIVKRSELEEMES